jgi:hypothetical protein
MIKTFFKLLLATTVYTVLFMAANGIALYTLQFKELGASSGPMALFYLFISSAWVCFTIYFLIKHSHYSGKRLFANIVCIMFFIQFFMTQIETLFFGNAFTALSTMDIILIMLAGLPPLLGATAIEVRFFQNKTADYEQNKINIKDTLIKLGIIGVIYLCVYMLFGYFVAWQFEELRLFYTGSNEKLSFWGQMTNNIRTNPIIIPFQIVRGILFGAAIVFVKRMLKTNKIVFIISVCLIYLCVAVSLIIPNVLFPDTVRIAHLIELTTSMLLFGIIVGHILWDNERKK